MNKEEVVRRLRQFVAENFLYARPDAELNNDDSLMGIGIVDSMGVMEMIEFLETEFGVIVEDEEITEDNLGTLSRLADFVQSHSGDGQHQSA